MPFLNGAPPPRKNPGCTLVQHTLQAFHEFRSHINKMVHNMDILEKYTSTEKFKTKFETPLFTPTFSGMCKVTVF